MSDSAVLARARPFDGLAVKPADPLLAIIAMHRDDPRPDKIDLGVGVFRDDAGTTPVMRAVKAAEQRLLEDQTSKGYLGTAGDMGFVEALRARALGSSGGDLIGMQTPGGSGALRLAMELCARASRRRVWMTTPTWLNHPQIAAAAGLDVAWAPYVGADGKSVDFDAMLDALDDASPGDLILLHGCCHNPTGIDLTADQWRALAERIAERQVVPFIDLAYQGLGDGWEQDAAATRMLLDALPDAIVAYSCDKNFGMYRERVGALWLKCADREAIPAVRSNLMALARANWSMPPDHGAAVVRIVLEDEQLAADWADELATMQARIAGLRTLAADASPALAPLAQQKGMFSTLPFDDRQIERLRTEHAIYVAPGGRVNIAGLNRANVERFAKAASAIL